MDLHHYLTTSSNPYLSDNQQVAHFVENVESNYLICTILFHIFAATLY